MCDRPLNLSSTFNKLPSLTTLLRQSSKVEAKELLESLKQTKENIVVKDEPMETDDQGRNIEDEFLFTRQTSEVIVYSVYSTFSLP